MMKILSSKHEKSGNKGRIFAAPKWLKNGRGIWQPFNRVVTVSETANGYRIEADLPKGRQVIEFERDAKTVGATKERRIRGRHFGDIVEKSKIAKSGGLGKKKRNVEYRVKGDGQFDEKRRAWRFDCDEDEIGLFLDDWTQRVSDPSAIEVDEGLARVDLDALQADAQGRVDLDPTIIGIDGKEHIRSEGTTWDAAQNGTGATFGAYNDTYIMVSDDFGGNYVIRRTYITFDTSELSGLTLASCNLNMECSFVTGHSFVAPYVIDGYALLDTSQWNPSNPENLTELGGDADTADITGIYVWYNLSAGDMMTAAVPLDRVDQDGYTSFQLRQLIDVIGTTPTSGIIVRVRDSGEEGEEPYLEYTEPSGGGDVVGLRRSVFSMYNPNIVLNGVVK